MAALALFLVTARSGRLWCGYACPQTVWTDLISLVERFEGDRNARMRLDEAPWSFDKIWRKGGKHLSLAADRPSTGGAWIFYFHDAPTLVERLHRPGAGTAYVSIGILTFTTYVLAGSCASRSAPICAPGRASRAPCSTTIRCRSPIGASRGEPRGPHKKGESWEGRGDCVDCGQCVVVCPMGIDIRDGAQLECIGCGLCIDACDEIMDKVGRPRKLIAYDSFRNLKAESHGDRVPFRLIRPRTMLYAGAFSLVGALMLFGLTHKTVLDVNVVPDRNPLFVQVSGGGIRNGYTVRILNKKHGVHKFEIAVTGLKNPSLSYVGIEAEPPIDVKSDDVRAVKVYVTVPPRGGGNNGAPGQYRLHRPRHRRWHRNGARYQLQRPRTLSLVQPEASSHPFAARSQATCLR